MPTKKTVKAFGGEENRVIIRKKSSSRRKQLQGASTTSSRQKRQKSTIITTDSKTSISKSNVPAESQCIDNKKLQHETTSCTPLLKRKRDARIQNNSITRKPLADKTNRISNQTYLRNKISNSSPPTHPSTLFSENNIKGKKRRLSKIPSSSAQITPKVDNRRKKGQIKSSYAHSSVTKSQQIHEHVQNESANNNNDNDDNEDDSAMDCSSDDESPCMLNFNGTASSIQDNDDYHAHPSKNDNDHEVDQSTSTSSTSKHLKKDKDELSKNASKWIDQRGEPNITKGKSTSFDSIIDLIINPIVFIDM